MICPFNHYQLFRLGKRRHQSFQLRSRTKLIARAADEQFWLRAIAQEFVGINAWLLRIRDHGSDRRAHANGSAHAAVPARSPQSYRRAKGKSRKDQRKMKLRIEPVERRAHVIHLAVSVIVFSLAQSSAAKVHAQDWKTEAVQRLHGVEYNLVVQRPAK